MTVAEAIEILKSMPQDAEFYRADFEMDEELVTSIDQVTMYRHREGYVYGCCKPKFDQHLSEDGVVSFQSVKVK